MQRANKTNNDRVNGASVQGYHQNRSGASNYAYAGFDGGTNKFFTSDRFETLDSNFKRPNGKDPKGYGLEITERVALKTPLNKYNERYIHTKIDKMEHLIDI